MILGVGLSSPFVTRAAFLAAASSCSFFVPNEFLSTPNLHLYYETSAPNFRDKVAGALENDPTLAGPLIRLAFHDAITWERSTTWDSPFATVTGGSNGSIRYELDWPENRVLSRPLQVVQHLLEGGRQEEEALLSLADAIALTGASAVEFAGGPRIPIRLGRQDAAQADGRRLRRPMMAETPRSNVTSTMPDAGLDSDGLRLYLGTRLGLKEEEIVALSGIHGLGRHVTLLGMSKSCLKNLTRTCLEEAPQSLPFVTSSVDRFSNDYFRYLLLWNQRKIQLGDVAFIPTDVDLVVDEGFRQHVERFAENEKAFARTFVRAFQKLVDATATSVGRY